MEQRGDGTNQRTSIQGKRNQTHIPWFRFKNPLSNRNSFSLNSRPNLTPEFVRALRIAVVVIAAVLVGREGVERRNDGSEEAGKEEQRLYSESVSFVTQILFMTPGWLGCFRKA